MRLKLAFEFVYTPVAGEFRFQTGAIKTAISDVVRQFKKEFRFQTGAIKTGNKRTEVLVRTITFRFQTGAIKTNFMNKQYNPKEQRFDSKLVRLKHSIVLHAWKINHRFDSKLVRLKPCGQFIHPYRKPSFDSKLVRLKRLTIRLNRRLM